MLPWKSGNINVHLVLKGRCNVYLIETEDKLFLVDTSTKPKRQKLVDGYCRLDFAERSLDALILTHLHFDHSSNAAFLKKIFGCKIIMSDTESGFASIGSTPLPAGTNLFTRNISMLGNWLMNQKPQFEKFEPDFLFNGIAQPTYLPQEIELLATPGHSAGSLSVVINNEIALVGDTLFGVFRNSAFPPFADNCAQLIASWKVLLTSGCSLFLPAHGSPIGRSILESEYRKYAHKYQHQKTLINKNA